MSAMRACKGCDGTGWLHESEGRCNYCSAPSVVAFSWTSRYSRMGSWRSMTITAKACYEHVGCANWIANRSLHPEGRMRWTVCQGCRGTGQVSDRIPAQDAEADAETLRLVAFSRNGTPYAHSSRVRFPLMDACTLTDTREMAHAALCAVPGLRGDR